MRFAGLDLTPSEARKVLSTLGRCYVGQEGAGYIRSRYLAMPMAFIHLSVLYYRVPGGHSGRLEVGLIMMIIIMIAE